MELTITKRYLVFPVSHSAASKQLSFCEGEKTLYSLSIMLDEAHPDFYAYVEVTPWIGKTITLSVEPQMTIPTPREADSINRYDLYEEHLRPLAHFTVKNGWNNDPNGLVYANGTYHMFYQYNPAATVWGTMHWGHATSPDLYHWEEQPVALYPDAHGTMFSGCAIVDSENRLGLKTGEEDVILLYYTAAGNPFTQRLAYTADNGKTFHQYGEILPELAPANRDPKVIYCEERGDFLMALYLTGDRYAIFASADLLHWEKLQELEIPGENECPDLFPLSCNGVRKWIFIGAHARYLIGEIQDGLFVPTQAPRRLQSDEVGYAAQTFSGIPGKVVRVLWDRLNIQRMPFSQQLGFPVTLSLIEDGEEYTLASLPLACAPVCDTQTIAPTTDESTRIPLKDAPYRLCLSAPADKRGWMALSIYGRELALDLDRHLLHYGGMTCPLGEGALHMEAVIDRCSTELFFDRGQYTCRAVIPIDRNLRYLSLRGAAGVTATLEEWEPMR